jgi:hypothetical protein
MSYPFYNRNYDYCGVGGYYNPTASGLGRSRFQNWQKPLEAPPVSDLKVTKERVVAAAAKCGDAARVLKELFPEAFPSPLVLGDGGTINGTSAIGPRVFGNQQRKAFYLATAYDWALVKDNEGCTVLVPTPKA